MQRWGANPYGNQNGKNGFIVPRRSAKRIASCLIELIGNIDLRKKMGGRNLAIAPEMANWDRNFDTLESVYARLVSRR